MSQEWYVEGLLCRSARCPVSRVCESAGRSTITDPYALLKELTRGHRVGAEELAAFVETLDKGDAAKQRLLALTPATYTGLAEELAR